MNSVNKRFTLFPIAPRYKEVYDLYKTHRACFWVPEEIDFTVDIKDWHHKLSQNERDFILKVLAFFGGSDIIVIKNLASSFVDTINNPEGEVFYAFQMGMEAIHSETYSMMIDIYTDKNAELKRRLFNAMENFPPIKLKADWATKWANNNIPLAQRIAAMGIVEGVFFSGAFCSIYWLKDNGLMPGLSLSNDFIARDEGLHTQHAALQYLALAKDEKLTDSRIHEMICEAVEVEREFIADILKYKLRGMNADLMMEYVKYTADRYLTMLGHPMLYGSKNPFDFMNRIGQLTKENFFEKRNSQYQKNGVMNNDMIKQLHNYYYQQSLTTNLNTQGTELLLEFARENGITNDVINKWLAQKNSSDTKGTVGSNPLVLDDDF